MRSSPKNLGKGRVEKIVDIEALSDASGLSRGSGGVPEQVVLIEEESGEEIELIVDSLS